MTLNQVTANEMPKSIVVIGVDNNIVQGTTRVTFVYNFDVTEKQDPETQTTQYEFWQYTTEIECDMFFKQYLPDILKNLYTPICDILRKRLQMLSDTIVIDKDT